MNVDTLYSLKERLEQIIPIETVDVNKLYEELLSFFSESLEEFIGRRHGELHDAGYKNKEIYPKIQEEIKDLLFKGPVLSERQVKRIIYKE